MLASGQNYPLPGVHDPTFNGAAIATYRNDSRSAALDELLRRMTQLDPARRPSADIVSHELTILGRETVLATPPDPTSSLNRLRAALVPHFTREEDEARQVRIANGVAGTIKAAIEDIAGSIHHQTNLSPLDGYAAPRDWGFHAYIGSPDIKWLDEAGLFFEAGGAVFRWQLGLGVKCQLLSDGNLVIHVGYHFNRLVNGQIANAIGGSRGWEEQGTAMNGGPTCRELTDRLVAGLKSNLPGVVDQFAQFVEHVSKS